MGNENFNTALESVIKSADIKSLAENYGELLLNRVLNDDSLKDIPFIGTAVKLISFGNEINRNLTIKKLSKFLFELESVSEKKRTKEIDKINNSKKYTSSVGEMLWEILDGIENEGKPEIIGKMFKAFLNKEIEYETFLKASYLIKSIFYYDLVNLKNNCNESIVINTVDETLFTYGLVTYTDWARMLDQRTNFQSEETTTKYIDYNPEDIKLTPIGKVIIEIGMM